MSQSVVTVGLISDTHGLLRDEALRQLEGSDLIIHAGDVGNPDILRRLREIAPLTVVRGNIDTDQWASAIPLTAVVKAGSALIHVLHSIDDLDLNPSAGGLHVVVSGHSHKPGQYTKAGVLYVNPGSAGPHRFKLPISMARLTVDGTSRALTFIDLAAPQNPPDQ